MKVTIMFSSMLASLAVVAGSMGKPPAEMAPAAFKSVACDFFTRDNAVKVLGGRVTGPDGGIAEKPDGRHWTCVFTASDRGENPPKLYFGLTKSPSEAPAKPSFETIRNSNRNHAGFEIGPASAMKAVVHTDGKNFQLAIILKGAMTIRAKVNPAAGTSLEALKTAMATLVSILEVTKRSHRSKETE